MEAPVTIATVGGEGTRLFPLTLRQPKPLLSMCGEAILGRALETLALQGCREFILASKGMENTTRFKDYFKRGEGFSKRLHLRPAAEFMYQPNYSDTGNGDALRFCMDYFSIKKDVLVVSGDNIIDIDLEDLLNSHRKRGHLLTVVLKEMGDAKSASQFGVAELEEDMRIKRFVEKPAEPPSRLISTAIYLFSPDITDVFKKMGDKVRDIGKDVIPYLVENGYPVYGQACEGYWADVGTPESYLKTTVDILNGKLGRVRISEGQTTLSRIFGLPVPYEAGQVIRPSTLRAIEQTKDVKLMGNAIVGGDCKIGKGAVIENSYIGDSCIIGENATIKNSVVMDFTNVGEGVRLNGCVIGRYSTIERGSVVDRELEVDVAMGNPDHTPVIGEGVTIVENSVIGPKKRVAPIQESHRILSTGRFVELGYDRNNVYFIER